MPARSILNTSLGAGSEAGKKILEYWTGTVVYTQCGTLDGSEDRKMRLGSVFGFLTSQDTRRIVFLLTCCYEIGDQNRL